MDIRIINAGSEMYEQMIELRVRQLLNPIGVPASYIDPEKEKQDIFIAAFKDEIMVGCCILTRKDDERIQLRQMAVRSDLRGKGIGAAIVAFAEQEAKKLQYKILMMHARDPVLGFYRKCGYRVVGKQFFEVGMGHHMMEKNL
jgi:GNAT superfamily N-acetyltransferase